MAGRRYLVVVVVTAAVIASAFVTSASAAGTTFAKTYSNIIKQSQFSLTPEDVQTTSDGGYVGLALTETAKGAGVSWLVKLSSTGTSQWHRELGCLSVGPGSYADGVSIAQTADGGYVVGGGTVGCGSGADCPASSGIQCALVEKLSSTGAVSWARVYQAGAETSGITSIRQTSDGGYIAVGTETDLNGNTGGLILKLDSQGNVQWQRQLGPAGKVQLLLNSVQQTSGGGYVAAGESYTPTSGVADQNVFAVKLDSSGSVSWQQAYNSFNGSGSPTASELASSIIQTSDGGYLVAGHWDNSPGDPSQCCDGALLLKLTAAGAIQWQNALSGGLYYYDGGTDSIGAVVYSVHQTSDGGYVLAGDGDYELQDSVPLVPWIAKVDSSGNLLWQHLYFQVDTATGRPLSEYFAGSALASDGGVLGLGSTENYSNGDDELFGVKTDSSGLVGASCKDLYSAPALSSTNPAFTSVAQALPVQTTVSPSSSSPSTSVATSISTHSDC